MNREIKFRAWDKVNKKMVKVGNLHFDQVGGFSFPVDVNGNVVNHYPIMQYTGLKDKNGKEIYEGDFLLFKNRSMQQGENLGFIKYDATRMCYSFVDTLQENYYGIAAFEQFDNSTFDSESFKIIGNIYENPELLK